MRQKADGISSTLAFGFLILDSPYMTQKRRAQVGFLAWSLPMLACICWMVANRTRFTKMDTTPAYDFTDPGWANGTCCIFLPCCSVSCLRHQQVQ